MLNTLLTEPTKSAVPAAGSRAADRSGEQRQNSSSFESHMRQDKAGPPDREPQKAADQPASERPAETAEGTTASGKDAAGPGRDQQGGERPAEENHEPGPAVPELPAEPLPLTAKPAIPAATTSAAAEPQLRPALDSGLPAETAAADAAAPDGGGQPARAETAPVQNVLPPEVKAAEAAQAAGPQSAAVAAQAAVLAESPKEQAVQQPQTQQAQVQQAVAAAGGQAAAPAAVVQQTVVAARTAAGGSSDVQDGKTRNAAPALRGAGESPLPAQAAVPETPRSEGRTVSQAAAAGAAAAAAPEADTAEAEPEVAELEAEVTEAPRREPVQTWRATAQPLQQSVMQQQMSAMMASGLAMQSAAAESVAEAAGSSLLPGELLGGEAAGLNQMLTEAIVSPGTVHRPEVPRMVAQQMAEAVAAKGDRNIEIALSPEELGRVKMRLSATESGMTVMITTERPETGDLMRKHINELAEEFRRMGYEDVSFEFSGESAGDGSAEDGDGSGQGGRSALLSTSGEAEDAAGELPIQQHLSLGETGLDMRM